MQDFSLDDVLKRGKGRSKKRRKQSQELTIGQQIVTAIEVHDEVMRQLHRQITDAEKQRLELLVNEAVDCGPAPEDAFIVNKLIDMMQTITESVGNVVPELDSDEDEIPLNVSPGERFNMGELAFGLGMAYERLQRRGLL
jgi:hypothetical protein